MFEKFFAKFQYNSPVILTYTLICAAALLLDLITGGWTNKHLFSVYRSGFLDLMQYPRLFTHIIGHANYAHFLSNFTVILLVGPMLEEKCGSRPMLKMILMTAFITGLIQVIFFPSTALLGASGIAFMLILLSSFANYEKGRIPITLILVAIIYLSGKIIDSVTKHDQISHLSHIIGGVCGTAFGWAITKPKKEAPEPPPAIL